MRKMKRFDWLAMIINENQFVTGAEIGAAIGITTEFILNRCPTLNNLTIVDLWEPVTGSSLFDRPDMEQIFRKKFEKEPKVSILKGVSWEGGSEIDDDSLDFVFVDASHDYDSVVKDIAAWFPKVKSGGIFCGHDLHYSGVVQATKERFGSRLREAGVDNVWYVRV